MMMGRDESMPNNVREPDMTSEERDGARSLAALVLATVQAGSGPTFLSSNDMLLLARACKRYVPAGVPAPAPHPVAAASDQTTRASLRDLPDGVICEPLAEESSGVVEPSDDGEGTRPVGDLSLTRAIDISSDDTRR